MSLIRQHVSTYICCCTVDTCAVQVVDDAANLAIRMTPEYCSVEVWQAYEWTARHCCHVHCLTRLTFDDGMSLAFSVKQSCTQDLHQLLCVYTTSVQHDLAIKGV